MVHDVKEDAQRAEKAIQHTDPVDMISAVHILSLRAILLSNNVGGVLMMKGAVDTISSYPS